MTQNQCLQKSYVYSNRLISIQKGNYTIQGVLKLTEDNSCEIVSLYGLINAFAIQYAVDNANKNPNLTQWANIGMRLDDNCRSLPVTMSIAIEFISMVRSNSVCRAEFLHCSGFNQTNPDGIEPATAIIGTERSSTTIPLAGLMSLYQIPLISHAASSPLLSNTNLYRSFFRTIPSDVHQVSAMLDIIKTFNWTFIIAIGSDDDYGKLAINDLKNRTANTSICIDYEYNIPVNSSSTVPTVKKVVNAIKDSRATVVILFCYVFGIGIEILTEANAIGLKRIWLTSDPWSPTAETINVTLKNQLHGIISISMKQQELPTFVEYMENEIKTNFLCNMWLKNYLQKSFECKPTNISNNKEILVGENNCSIEIKPLVKRLSSLGEKTGNLVDAVTVLTRAIYIFLKKNCKQGQTCSIPKINPAALTDIVRNISFLNSAQDLVEFDQSGDASFVFYTIENLQFINGTPKFKIVGNWNKSRGNSLVLNKDQIQWPSWFKKLNNEYPASRCSNECQKGEYYISETNCCWKCEMCKDSNYSNTIMASKCETCQKGHHTKDHINCVVTPIFWLTFKDAEGIAIFIASGIGLLLSFVSDVLLFKFRQFIITDESSPHIITLSCLLCFLTFCFGFLHIVEPSLPLCHVRNGAFFLLLMGFSSFLIIKTKFLKKYLERNAKSFLKGRLFLMQLMLVIILLLLELGTIFAWVRIDSEQNPVATIEADFKIEKRCFLEFTAARLVSTFIPFILLIAATFCAFRERNNAHTFYEPKFLSFTSIALCIIIVAFLPTFKYVKGNFQAVVMAFTASVLGFTFMACLVLPKVYVGLARFRHGVSFIQAKPIKAKISKRVNAVEPNKAAADGVLPSDAENTVTKITSIDNGELNNKTVWEEKD